MEASGGASHGMSTCRHTSLSCLVVVFHRVLCRHSWCAVLSHRLVPRCFVVSLMSHRVESLCRHSPIVSTVRER